MASLPVRPILVAPTGKRSEVWKSFGFVANKDGQITNDKQVVCRQCFTSVAYSGNTSNMTQHTTKCLKVYNVNKKQSTLNFSVNKKMDRNSKRYKEITAALVEFITTDLRPISVIEGEGFVKLMSLLVPDYVIPSRKTITCNIEELARKKREDLREELQRAEAVCLTVDFWTSIAVDSYCGVTCHFVDDEWKLQTRAVEVVQMEKTHKAEHIAELLRGVEERWAVENKVVAYVTDNAPNMVKAVEIMKAGHVRCAAHTVQLSVTNALKVQAVSDLLSKGRSIVGHFKRSPHEMASLHESQASHNLPVVKLIQDVSTRWNSTYEMLKSVTVNREAINQVVLRNDAVNHMILISRENGQMKALAELLEVFAEATPTLVGEKYVTGSIAYPVVKNLLAEVVSKTEDSRLIKEVKGVLQNDLKSRRAKMGLLPAKSSALDPRFKKLSFFNEQESSDVWTDLNEEFLKLAGLNHIQQPLGDGAEESDTDEPLPIQPKKKNPRLLQFDDDSAEEEETVGLATNEFQSYRELRISGLSVEEKQDPLLWWKQNQATFPVMSKLAKKYLSIVATSVPCERLFSVAGLVVTKNRSRLTGNHVECG